ncbi:hypothetical protein CS542_00245 [Pedobacter sp. IW39]|nr:hypothetical protein CS542_00245 [Pedobacter sp. IW39]
MISPDGRYINEAEASGREGRNDCTEFCTASGYTEDIPGRTKVGEPLPVCENFIYDQQRDTVYKIQLINIPGIKDLPDYRRLSRNRKRQLRKMKTKSRLSVPIWNAAGTMAV